MHGAAENSHPRCPGPPWQRIRSGLTELLQATHLHIPNPESDGTDS